MGRTADPEIAAKYKIEFGERLARYRSGLGWSQGQFAARLEISEWRYAKYERGKAEMPYWLLDKLKAITGEGLDYWVLGRASIRVFAKRSS